MSQEKTLLTDCKEDKSNGVSITCNNVRKRKPSKEKIPVVNLRRLVSLRNDNQDVHKMNIFKFAEAKVLLSAKRRRKCRFDLSLSAEDSSGSSSAQSLKKDTTSRSKNLLNNKIKKKENKNIMEKRAKKFNYHKRSEITSDNVVTTCRRNAGTVFIKPSQFNQKTDKKHSINKLQGKTNGLVFNSRNITTKSKNNKLKGKSKAFKERKTKSQSNTLARSIFVSKYSDLSVKLFDGYVHITLCPKKERRFRFNPLDLDDDEKTSGSADRFQSSSPSWFNCFTPTVLDEMTLALERAQEERNCKAILLSSVGAVFSGGFDLRYFTFYAAQCDKERLLAAVDSIRKLVDCLINFTKPIVAAVQGLASGLAASLLLLCDMVLLDERAAIQFSYPQMGLSPLACSSYLIPTLLQHSLANSLLYGDRVLTAAESLQHGIASEIFPHDSFMRNVIPRVRQVCSSPLVSLTVTKQLVRSRHASQLVCANESERRALRRCLSSPECLRTMRNYVHANFS